MKPEDFRTVLEKAVRGSHEALEKIFELYDHFISKHSWGDGNFDEDLKQYILIHIAFNISKFDI